MDKNKIYFISNNKEQKSGVGINNDGLYVWLWNKKGNKTLFFDTDFHTIFDLIVNGAFTKIETIKYPSLYENGYCIGFSFKCDNGGNCDNCQLNKDYDKHMESDN